MVYDQEKVDSMLESVNDTNLWDHLMENSNRTGDGYRMVGERRKWRWYHEAWDRISFAWFVLRHGYNEEEKDEL